MTNNEKEIRFGEILHRCNDILNESNMLTRKENPTEQDHIRMIELSEAIDDLMKEAESTQDSWLISLNSKTN